MATQEREACRGWLILKMMNHWGLGFCGFFLFCVWIDEIGNVSQMREYGSVNKSRECRLALG